MGIVQEFKEFAVKGNAMDMAVGIIIGASFNGVVQSIVNDLIMPPIGMALGQVDFKDLRVVLKDAVPAATDAAGKVLTPEAAEVAIRYGAFINTCINFVIVAFSVFIVVKLMNRAIAARPFVRPAP
jgi:large conductance mechanosensitive channel